MEERDFFDERTEQRKHTLSCTKCGVAGEYSLTNATVPASPRPKVIWFCAMTPRCARTSVAGNGSS